MFSCDKFRSELIEALKRNPSWKDNSALAKRYFAQVDDRGRTNNFRFLIEDFTRDSSLLANPRLWEPISPGANLDRLISQLCLDWPKKNILEAERLVTTSVLNKPKSTNSENIETAHDPILDDPRLKNVGKDIAQRILNELVDKKGNVKWDDIAGLDDVKQAVNEIVVYPMQNPELFQGLLSPAKGLLLFGPPGTGKTLIGKCIACESGATFFAISASSLTSKWIGEGEKLVRALFAVARIMQPSVVFIDEIDSLLTHRSDSEHDATRKIKTEFLVQFDGVATSSEDRLLIIGATNRPHELDEAARRRFTKRLYVPLPNKAARTWIIKNEMSKDEKLGRVIALTDECVNHIADKAEGFSGADMNTLCRAAALVPVREVIKSRGGAKDIGRDDIPAINRSHFESAFRQVKASVGELSLYESWNDQYGAS